MLNGICVYILESKRHGTLYIGVTNDLSRRLTEHSLGKGPKFARAYNVNRLVHVELFDNIEFAIVREKQLKKWNREWKVNLIEREILIGKI